MSGMVPSTGDSAVNKAAVGCAPLEPTFRWGNRQCPRKHKINSTLTEAGNKGAELENEGGGLRIKKEV